MKQILMCSLVAFLAACGGGGSSLAVELPVDGPGNGAGGGSGDGTGGGADGGDGNGSGDGPSDEPSEPLNIQIIGDSIFAWNSGSGQTVGAFLAEQTGANITDFARSGAQVFVDDEEAAARGLDILEQFEPGDWDWVIMNGGANDVEEDCGCGECDVILDDIISPDANGGRLPEFVRGLQDQGIGVIYLGYFQIGIEDTDSAECVDEFDALDDRISRLAGGLDGVFFQSGIGLLSTGDLASDGIHPNPVGSEILAMALREAIEAAQ